ncbi:acyltransferase family protein [Deinococcus ficus]|nr:acyltransferase [Deinococcus ficus]
MNQPSVPTSIRNRNFDGLRGLLVLAVIFSHLGSLTYVPFAEVHKRPSLTEHVAWYIGAPAVDVFLVLSGLVVAQSFMRHGTALRYGAARFKRLYPLGLAGTLLGLLIAHPLGSALTHVPLTGHLPEFQTPLTLHSVVNWLGLGILGDIKAHNLNPPLWSLAVELYASVLIPAMVLLARRVGWASLAPFTVVMVVLAFAFYPMLFMPIVMLGVLIAVCPPRWSDRWNAPAILIGAVLLALRIVLGTDLPFFRYVSAIGAGLVLLGLRADLGGPLHSRVPQWLGRNSYALYVSHYPAIVAGCALLAPFVGYPLAGWLSLPLVFVAGAALQGAVERLVYTRAKTRTYVAANISSQNTTNAVVRARTDHAGAGRRRP